MKSFRLGARSTVVLALALALTGCPQATAVWLEPGARVGSVNFLVSARRGGGVGVEIGLLRVDRCADSTRQGGIPVWLITGAGGSAAAHRVTYGDVPPGFALSQPPKPLLPGCYRVIVSGTGRMLFDVREDSTVIERLSP